MPDERDNQELPRQLPLDVQALQEHSRNAKLAADNANRRAIDHLTEALDRYAAKRATPQPLREQRARATISRHLHTDSAGRAKLLLLLVLAILLQRIFAMEHHTQSLSAGYLYAAIDVLAAWALLHFWSRR